MRRVKWGLMFVLSAAIGLLVLAFRFIQAAGSAQLYAHPAPVGALLSTALAHANESYGRDRGQDQRASE